MGLGRVGGVGGYAKRAQRQWPEIWHLDCIGQGLALVLDPHLDLDALSTLPWIQASHPPAVSALVGRAMASHWQTCRLRVTQGAAARWL